MAKKKKKEKDMLQISLKRGEYITYKSKSYTDYMVQKGLFVVLNGSQWIGIYNLDCVEYAAFIKGGDHE